MKNLNTLWKTVAIIVLSAMFGKDIAYAVVSPVLNTVNAVVPVE